MANFSLVTVSRGEIKSVDGFIKTFNSIGHNMKVLAVSAYDFMTSDDKDLSIEFGKRVRDELNLSKATISNLRTAGWLYSLSDVFEKFSYTNVILFKKNVEKLKDENGVIDMVVLHKFIEELALLSNSKLVHDLDNYVNYLSGLSQKDLKHIIEVFNTPVAEAKIIEESDELSEDVEEVEESEDKASEELEGQLLESHMMSYLDDDIYIVISKINDILDNIKATKKDYAELLIEIRRMLNDDVM